MRARDPDPVGKVLALVLGAALAVVFAVMGVDAWRDYRAFGDAPQRTGLLGAIEASSRGRQWVSIEGATWRCDRVLQNVDGGVAFLPATAEDGSLVVARFDHAIRCDALASAPLTGIIEAMTPKGAADLRAAGLEVANDRPLRTFNVCVSCGRDNAQLGVLICACFVLLGLAAYPLRRAYGTLSGRAQGSLTCAIHAAPEQAAAANRTVRRWGGLLLGVGALCIALGQDYVLYRAVPLRWLGGVPVLLGLWMTAFPASYRRLSARRSAR